MHQRPEEISIVLKPGISPYSGKAEVETYGAYPEYERAKERMAELEKQGHLNLRITTIQIRY